MVDYTRTVDPDPGRPKKDPGQVPATSGEATNVDNFFNSEYGDLPEASALSAEEMDLNIEEKNDAFIIEAELEGYEEDEIDVELIGDRLVLKASKRAIGKSGDELYHLKKKWPDIDATVDVKGVDPNGLNISFDGYVLTITLEKRTSDQ